MRSTVSVLFVLGSVLCDGQTATRFASWTACSTCHGKVAAPAGAGAELPLSIGPADLWGGSMMAHSSRDPYWRAKVRFESASAPSKAAVIQDTCLRCHAPMQQYDLRPTGTNMALDDLNPLGREGVGCTVCHQIEPEGLGTHESFEANFKINDRKVIYGPHANPFANPMINNTGYTPVEAKHIMDSAMCGSCHTVITPVLDANEEIKGEFVEQAPYLEWLVSKYPGEGKTCQSCHMPTLRDADGTAMAVAFAHQPNGRPFPAVQARAPFGLHFMSGANVPMLEMLLELIPAEDRILLEARNWTRRLLEGALELNAEAEREDGLIKLEVKVINRTGHKLPTAYPSRRVWLRVQVTDAAGNAVFESGAWDPETGEIKGLRGVEPHRDVVTAEDQTVIYETELADLEGNPTVSLLRAASSFKDNRLLPAGFDLSEWHLEGVKREAIQPVGVENDDNFEPGSDKVLYSIRTVGEGPFTILIEALYQTIRPGHTAGMDPGRTMEEWRFLDVFSRHNAPVRMAERTLVVKQ